MDALKLCNVMACLHPAEKLFRYFTPLKEKYLLPFAA